MEGGKRAYGVFIVDLATHATAFCHCQCCSASKLVGCLDVSAGRVLLYTADAGNRRRCRCLKLKGKRGAGTTGNEHKRKTATQLRRRDGLFEYEDPTYQGRAFGIEAELPLISSCVNQDAAFRLTGSPVFGQIRDDHLSTERS